MADMSAYIRDKIYNKVLRGIDFTTPGTKYLALFTVITDAVAGTGTEVSTSGTAYARVAVAFTDPAGTGAGQATADAVFATATADWGTVVGGALVDSASGAYNALTRIKTLPVAKAVNNGETFVVPAANLTEAFS